MTLTSYEFRPGSRSILSEIFLPKRIALQGTIYSTLEAGLTHKNVIAYLHDNAESLVTHELRSYPHWFDPNLYGGDRFYPNKVNSAKARMLMCEQVFFGWSTYEVNGVFLKHDGVTVDEELTQVIRLIFKFDSLSLLKEAEDHGYSDVYHAIVQWILASYRSAYSQAWDTHEMQAFLRRHSAWRGKKREFVKEYYPQLAKVVSKWIDDCGLFVFGYVVREIWSEIVKRHTAEKERLLAAGVKTTATTSAHLEDEIWVAGLFQYVINVMAPTHNK